MIRMRELKSAAVVAVALVLLPLSGTALAHGAGSEQAAEFEQHLDEYAGEINDMLANVSAIVAAYEPGNSNDEQLNALIEQWESVHFHEALETNAMPLYPPIWAALGTFSSALKEGASEQVVRARADDIAAALWQGYGGLKLLAARQDQNRTPRQPPAAASGDAVIETINSNLDQVLTLYKKGESDAAQKLIYDTYMNYFEGIEGDLIEQDAALVTGLEADFNATLPLLLKNDAPAEEVAAQIDAMQADLGTARELLAAAAEQESSVF